MFFALYKTYERILIRSQEFHMVQIFKGFSERFGKPLIGILPGGNRPSYKRFFIAVERNGEIEVLNDPYGIEDKVKLRKGIQEIEGEHYLVMEINRGGERYYIVSNISPIITAFSSMKRLGILLSFLGISLSFVAGYVLSQFSLKPMRNLIRELRKIEARTLNMRLENPKSGDEMEELVYEINSMLDRIEEAYRSQERFVHDVSHELRNPLASLKGFIRILEKFGCGDEKLFEESISEIGGLVEEMVSMVENLLMLSRSDRSFEVSDVDVFSLVLDVVEKMRRVFPKREIRLEEHARPVLRTSPELFQIVVKNLVENALKYSPEGEPVVIRVMDCRIEVSDRGPGIPEDERERIFERFYRIDVSRDRRKKGHGLGLAIVKELSQRLGLRVALESEVGRGSTFKVVWKECESTEGRS